jgi:hypothetical protein
VITIECHTWTNGSPVVAWTRPVLTTEDGMTVLTQIGASQSFDVNSCFWLMQGEHRLAILHIYPDRTWRIERSEQAA